MIFRKNHEFSKILRFSGSGPQDGIDSWDPLGVGAGRREGGGQPERPRRPAQDVGRGPPGPGETGAIIETR